MLVARCSFSSVVLSVVLAVRWLRHTLWQALAGADGLIGLVSKVFGMCGFEALAFLGYSI
jgi:hypothetical protein